MNAANGITKWRLGTIRKPSCGPEHFGASFLSGIPACLPLLQCAYLIVQTTIWRSVVQRVSLPGRNSINYHSIFSPVIRPTCVTMLRLPASNELNRSPRSSRTRLTSIGNSVGECYQGVRTLSRLLLMSNARIIHFALRQLWRLTRQLEIRRSRAPQSLASLVQVSAAPPLSMGLRNTYLVRQEIRT